MKRAEISGERQQDISTCPKGKNVCKKEKEKTLETMCPKISGPILRWKYNNALPCTWDTLGGFMTGEMKNDAYLKIFRHIQLFTAKATNTM